MSRTRSPRPGHAQTTPRTRPAGGPAGGKPEHSHVFASLQAKAVAWDFSLDGNLFRPSHRVDRRPWVAQAAAGISGQWFAAGHGLRLALMRLWRTREFAGQRGGHAFGSIALSLEL
ncbi:MAG: DUF2219 family protein [Rubrivivax sp.]